MRFPGSALKSHSLLLLFHLLADYKVSLCWLKEPLQIYELSHLIICREPQNRKKLGLDTAGTSSEQPTSGFQNKNVLGQHLFKTGAHFFFFFSVKSYTVNI